MSLISVAVSPPEACVATIEIAITASVSTQRPTAARGKPVRPAALPGSTLVIVILFSFGSPEFCSLQAELGIRRPNSADRVAENTFPEIQYRQDDGMSWRVKKGSLHLSLCVANPRRLELREVGTDLKRCLA